MRVFAGVLSVLTLLCCSLAFAESSSDNYDNLRILDNYGYIVGTLNTTIYEVYKDDDDPHSQIWAPYGLEDYDNPGRFMHYYFFVNAGSNVYKCVIDFKDVGDYDSPYRIIDMNPAYEDYYNGIFDAVAGWHPISHASSGYGSDPASGALDYIRHPGILLDLKEDINWHPRVYTTYNGITSVSSGMFPLDQNYYSAWSDNTWNKLSIVSANDPLHSGHYYASTIDNLFNGVTKLYVFGQHFDNGYGLHNIHQYQGDRDNSGYEDDDGTFQDGAVIFEYADGSRKLLMVKLGDHYKNNQFVSGQIDFSYDGPTGSHIQGEAAPFTYLSLTYNPATDGDDKIFGPYTATQIEVISSGDEEIILGYQTDISIALRGSNSTSALPFIKADHSSTSVEYLRSSYELWNMFTLPRPLVHNPYTYYVHVKREHGLPINANIPIYVRYR